jgi:Fe-S-cluster containining protein
MDFKKKFYDITDLIQREFDRNLELYGDKIQCRKGCSKCCSQIFRITPLDGWIITEHVKSLPDEERTRLVEKAKEYIAADHPVSPSHPSLTKEGTVISLPLSGGDTEGVLNLPCPALGAEGECTIYEARPVICRRFGMPIYDYKNPDNVHACELNFSDGEEITDPLLIPNQTEIGKKWDEVKEEFITLHLPLSGGDTEGVEGTTIAEAIERVGKD